MRHFLFAFCRLLISVSDSIEVGEILGHWLGYAAWDFFSSHFVFLPLPPSPLASMLSFSPRCGCLFVLKLDLVVIRKWCKAAGLSYDFGPLLKCQSLDLHSELSRAAVEWKGG